MTGKQTVTRQDIGKGHIVFTRSDGEVFHLKWQDDSGQASLYHENKPPPAGISLDVSIPDKPRRAEQLILDYPTGWP